METNNWRNTSQGGEPVMDTADWRNQLQPDSRQRIVNKIMDTLKRHLPFSGQEGLNELKKIAGRFEEKIYTVATSQSDYLRKISLRMLSMESKSQNPMPNSLPSNTAGNSNKPPDQGTGMQNQVHNQGQSLPIPMSANQSQASMMQSAPLSSLQQNQQSSVQQLIQSMIQQNQQQSVGIHQQQVPMIQPSMMPPQQQQQLMGQPSNASNMQQNQLIGQQNSVNDIQQQQQQRLLGQQSNLPNIQQQQMLAQQNLSSMRHQQLGPQSNVSGLQPQQQQQLLGNQSGNSSMQTNQHSAHMLQQSKVLLQQQSQQSVPLLPNQGQQSESQQPQQQSMSQIQSQPAQLQQQLGLQQQPNQLQQNMQQRLQASSQAAGSLLQPQNVMDQRKQLYQSQRALPETSSLSLDSTAQTGQANGGDWQEEVYQKIKAMKETYLPELNEMSQKIATKLQQHDSLPQQPKSEQLEKLKIYKTMLDRIITFLQVSKSDISPNFREKLGSYEKQIINFVNTNGSRKPVSSLQPGQLPQVHMHSIQQPQSQLTQVQSHDNQMNPHMQTVYHLLATGRDGTHDNTLTTVSGSGMQNQGQSLPIPLSANESQPHQRLFSQYIQNNMTSTGLPGSSGLPFFLPSVSGLREAPITHVVNQISTMQNISGVSQNTVPSMGQGVPSNLFANSQMEMQSRLQVLPQLQQQQPKQKLELGSLLHLEQQPSLLQPNQLQFSQQSGVQSSSVMPSKAAFTKPAALITLPSTMPSQKQQQQHLNGQPSKAANLLQNQLIGQHSVGDIEQQLHQQLLGQQSNILKLQQQQQQRIHALIFCVFIVSVILWFLYLV